MKIVYAFIYYFTLLMVALTLSLTVFLLSPFRRLLLRFKNRISQIFQNDVIKYTIYLIFTIILLIFSDSVYTFSSLKSYFKKKSKYSPESISLKDLDLLSSSNQQDYMSQLKSYREYYMAERNILLSFSALFVFYAFYRILHSIIKYSQTQHKISLIENAKQSSNKIKQN